MRDSDNRVHIIKRNQGFGAGFEATEYELTTRTYLALMLDSIDLEDLLKRMDEDIASEVLAAIATLT